MVTMNTLTWSYQSFTAPFTATGRSALVPRPPWHYACWLLNIGFRFDAQSAAPLALLAAGKPVGKGCLLDDIVAEDASAGWLGITVSGASNV
jgi:hypothetical protein